jgi:hypothetical protein
MTNDIDDEMRKALAGYSGPVTRCHPGNARGKRVKVKPPVQDRPVNVGHERRHLKADDVARWLTQHDEDALSAEHQRARRRVGAITTPSACQWAFLNLPFGDCQRAPLANHAPMRKSPLLYTADHCNRRETVQQMIEASSNVRNFRTRALVLALALTPYFGPGPPRSS